MAWAWLDQDLGDGVVRSVSIWAGEPDSGFTSSFGQYDTVQIQIVTYWHNEDWSEVKDLGYLHGSATPPATAFKATGQASLRAELVATVPLFNGLADDEPVGEASIDLAWVGTGEIYTYSGHETFVDEETGNIWLRWISRYSSREASVEGSVTVPDIGAIDLSDGSGFLGGNHGVSINYMP